MAVDFNVNSLGVNQVGSTSVFPAGVSASQVNDALLTFNNAVSEGKEEDIAEAYAELKSLLGLSSTTEINEANVTKKSDEIKAEIEKLEAEKEANIKAMEKVEEHIEDLTDKAEKNIMKAAKAQDKAVKEHEKETEEVLDEQLRAYINANKEGGKGMSRDELQENIKSAMPNLPQVAEAVAALAAANSMVNEIDLCLGELNKLIVKTNAIEQNIGVKQTEYDAAVKAEEAEKAACCPPPKSCDPIGFTMGEGAEQVRYDFIVDDGAFDTTSDFLGAENQWAEMAALDKDGDGIVNTSELKEGNIKAVKTNADGTQSIVDLAEEFDDNFSIDLNSYKEGGSHSAIDTVTDSDGDGVVNQELLGTFNLNIKGQTVNGYNTLDDVDFLAENYGVSTGANIFDGESTEVAEAGIAEDLQTHQNFFDLYSVKSSMLREDIKMGYDSLGISKEHMATLDAIAEREAMEEAKNFFASLEVEEEEEEEPAAVEEAEVAEEIEEEVKEEELEVQEEEIAA